MPLQALSAFSGAGGLDLGLEAAGFEIVGCIERDSLARQTLKTNRPNWPLLAPPDIRQLVPKLHPGALGLQSGSLDLLAGGPPCQPFSKAAQWTHRGRAGWSDERSRAIDAFLDLIQILRPKAVLIENVIGFVKGQTSAIPYLEHFFHELEECEGVSYFRDWRVVDAADYGVPQWRKRALVVALRDQEVFHWPEPTHANRPVRAWDALADIETDGIDLIPESLGKWVDLLPSIPEGHNYQWHTDRGGGRPLFGYRTRFWSFLLKLAKNRPSWTLPAQPGPSTGPFHWDNRPLTVREMLRLQSFPENWVITGSYRQQVKQVGNATPALLGEVFGRVIATQVNGIYFPESLKLEIPRKSTVPPSAPTRPVPEKYRGLEGDHPPHPGPGLGPNPRKE